MKIAQSIIEELDKMEWERMGSDSTDYRMWTVFVCSKVLHRFITENYETVMVANGVFTNTTNPPPPYIPVPTPTIAVPLTAMPPQFKGHKELYEAMLPWYGGSSNYEIMESMFKAIFHDWLGMLIVYCGQDSTVFLPVVAAGTPNVAPPYFWALDSSALPANHPTYTYLTEIDGTYPKYADSEAGNGGTVDLNAQGTSDAINEKIAFYDTALVNNEALIPEAQKFWTDAAQTEETALANKLYYDAEWITAWDTAMASGDSLVSEASALDDPTEKMNEANASYQTAQDIDDNMLAVGTGGYSRKLYPECLSRLDALNARKTYYEKLKSFQADSAGSAPVYETDPNAPEIVATIKEPNPPSEQEWVVSPAYPISKPMQFSWANYASHSSACVDELSESAPDTVLASWEIIAKHLVSCLNDNVPISGGGVGYCYGSISNLWSGVVSGKITWIEK